jgi:hypothetical protein
MLNDNDRGEVLKSYKSKGGRKKLAAFEDYFFKEELGRQILEYKKIRTL